MPFQYCIYNDISNIRTALFAATVTSFAPTSTHVGRSSSLQASSIREEVDTIGNNVIVKELLEQVESTRLLSKVAESGLLSKAQDAGLSLSKLEPLLKLAAQKPEILILTEAATPEILPLLPKIVEIAPPALPLLAQAIAIPPAVISGAGIASLAAAAAVIVVVPDDSLITIAGQTFAASLLGGVGIASLVGGSILGKILD